MGGNELSYLECFSKPKGCITIFPSLISMYPDFVLIEEALLAVAKASNMIVFKDNNFKERLLAGLHAFRVETTVFTDYAGNNFWTTGLELKIPFINLVINGCCPTKYPSYWGKVEDKIDLYSIYCIVLYCNPWSYNSAKKFKTSLKAGEVDDIPYRLAQAVHFPQQLEYRWDRKRQIDRSHFMYSMIWKMDNITGMNINMI